LVWLKVCQSCLSFQKTSYAFPFPCSFSLYFINFHPSFYYFSLLTNFGFGWFWLFSYLKVLRYATSLRALLFFKAGDYSCKRLSLKCLCCFPKVLVNCAFIFIWF
jgi:hypothetical protein